MVTNVTAQQASRAAAVESEWSNVFQVLVGLTVFAQIQQAKVLNASVQLGNMEHDVKRVGSDFDPFLIFILS